MKLTQEFVSIIQPLLDYRPAKSKQNTVNNTVTKDLREIVSNAKYVHGKSLVTVSLVERPHEKIDLFGIEILCAYFSKIAPHLRNASQKSKL